MTKDQMANRGFTYETMIEEALRGVVRRVLKMVQKDGLPGDHHIYLTFRTDADGVDVSDTIRSRWPEEMTIVIQHQYWDLEVYAERFSVTLSFSDVAQKLVIPYAAITAFADPSVKFGLQFMHQTDAQDESDEVPAATAPSGSASTLDEPPAADGANVVALDKFRRR
jgi:hypothetical protein